MEISSCIKAVGIAANQFKNNRSSSNMGYLLHQLEILQTVSARSESMKALHPKEMVTLECLSCLTDIISNVNNKSGLVLQCLHILTNLAKDRELCRMMKEGFSLDHVLASIIKTCGGSPDEQLTLVCLQLLQRVTYGHRISFHESFVDDLIKYLVKQISSPPSPVTKSCLGVLANLCQDNFPIQARIKSMDNVQRLYKTVCQFFGDEDMTTAIFALSVFTSLALTEELGDKVFFDSQNTKQVLQLVFNVLINGEEQTARSYAADLLQEMLRNSRLQQAVEEYQQNLPKLIEDTLMLISSSSVHSVAKIFELLISFCALGSLRSCMCQILFSGSVPPASELGEALSKPPRPDCPPLVATVCWAALPSATACKASLAAMEFLKEMYEEVLCREDQDMQSGMSLVLPVLVGTLRDPLDPDSPNIKNSCGRLSGTLRLLLVLCSEDEIKLGIAESVKAQDFASLLQFQLTSNKTVQRQSASLKSVSPDQDWGLAGVEVVLLSMQLMSKIRRYVDGLEQYFFQLLQDKEMVPFLARGWTSKDRDLVQIALQLTCKGAALDNFPDVILGDAVAATNASAAPKASTLSESAMDISVTPSRQSSMGEDKENLSVHRRAMGDLSLQSMQTADDSIQSLIEKMHSSIELRDLKTADIIEIYEHRLQSHQTKEDHLQDLLEAKSMALTQADRLIAQYRSRQARHGAEAHKMRCLYQEAERKNEGLLQEMNEIKLDKDRLKNEYDLLKHEKNQLELKALELEELKGAHADLCDKCEEMESCLTRQQQELKTTLEMHEILQKHYESLKHQHDIASEQLKKLEDERKLLARTLKEKEAKLLETSKALQTLTEKHSRVVKDREELEQEKDALEKCVDKLRADISLLEQTKKEMQQRMKSLEKLNQEQEEGLQSYNSKIQNLEVEVSKHAQIAQLIHSLSSGQNAPPGTLPAAK
ncbi:protein CIP2A homolog L-like [Littorina saxatilis]|uniref:CIP2A N-terminal domain-containing protein n=1 Tax=Littorina saxatilis TaxID=31220 RepID=A0AAN9GFM8_9CAEN